VLAIVYDMCRMNFGQAFSPQRVAFRHVAPADASPYETLFGCPVAFGADANRLLIGRAEADHPLPTGTATLQQPMTASLSSSLPVWTKRM
jgi:hypothetical protein